jgi:hypothetical protein
MACHDLQFHEAANIFPLINGEEFDGLVEDVRKNGQRESIKLLDGKILDGRNRYRACLLANCEPKLETVSVDDPVAYVLSLNLHRRHLTPSQSAMCAARARDIYEQQAKERLNTKGGHSGPVNLPEAKGDARDAAGKAFGVSGKSVDHAKRVIEQGIPELAVAVDSGRMAVSTAAILATEPEEVQRAEIEHPKRNRTYKPGSGGGAVEPKEEIKEEPPEGEVRGVGVRRAHDAIACLKKIPKNDLLRKRAFQIVADYIKQNR